MTSQIEITRKIDKIKDLIEEYAQCPDEISLLKTAIGVYEIASPPYQGEGDKGGNKDICPYTKDACNEPYSYCPACEVWANQSGLCRSY